jgi:hypothetical protein
LLKFAGNAAITPEQIRMQLAPVLDFRSVSQDEAYQKTLPPVLAAALKEHRALVGMDRDMVLAALGRPPSRLRETSRGGEEYEEWIYGSPPREVQFIRFVRDKVVRIEEMKVTGEKLVRTQDEVGKLDGMPDAASPKAAARGGSTPGDAATPPAMASPAAPESEAAPGKPPTLLRPGERTPGRGQAAPIALPGSAPEAPEN